MDNVTHTLIGITLGHAALRFFKKEETSTTLVRSTLWIAALASNAPDLDFVVTPFFEHRQLAYLLHHRGHTHTFLIALPLGLLIAWLFARAADLGRQQKRFLYVVGALAGLLHLGFDFWNDYGVHPFWPLDNRWFYGGMIFIVEPLFFALLLPFVFFSSSSRWSRAVCALIGCAILGLVWFGPFTPQPVPTVLTGIALLWVWLQWRYRSAWLSLGGVALLLIVFAVSGWISRERVQSALQEQKPHERLFDISSSPFPANPFCWRILTASRNDQSYFARSATVSLLPGFEPHECGPAHPRPGDNVSIRTPSIDSQKGMRWFGEFTAPVSEFRMLAEVSCGFRALLHFARMPYWTRDGDGWLAGDLRYVRGPGMSFADIHLPKEMKCTDATPPWIPPRMDLIHP